jgi:hypothetical protein
MQEQLQKELKAIASKITTLDHTSDINALKNEAKAIYEKLTVLEFVATNIDLIGTKETENNAPVFLKEEKKEEIIIETAKPATVIPEIKEKVVEMATKEVIPEEIKIPEVELEPKQETIIAVVKKVEEIQKPQEITKEIPVTTKKESANDLNSFLSTDDVDTIFNEEQWQKKEVDKKSLNRKLIPEIITVGLNDRIAFVNNLFNYSQADFNRVLSQLNTIDNEQAAYEFINKRVKPEYDWTGKEEYEARLLDLIARRFL